jgi:hypothetical protein
MAGSNKYSYYSNSALNDNFFLKINLNTDWFDEVTRTEHILKIIYPFQDQQKNKVSVGNYEEKAVLNGLDYSRTTLEIIMNIKFLRN